MGARANNYVVACLTVCVIGLLAWITAPDIRPFGAQVVPPASMIYFPGDQVGQPVPAAEGRAQLERKAKDAVQPKLLQLHFPLPTSAGVSLYMLSSPDDAALWINGMVGGDSSPSAFFGPGFGPHRLSREIPASRLSFETNRVDLLSAQGWAAEAMPLIFAIPARTGPAFAAMMEQVEVRLWQGAAVFGGLGLVLSLAGLLLLRSRSAFAGGALFSLALLDQASGFLMSWLHLVLAVAGIGVLLASKGWRPPVLGGALAAASIGVLIASALAVGWPASLPLAWGSNVVLWPLAGLVMPYLAFGEGRLVWADFISARARLRAQAAVIEQQADALQESIRAAAVSEERQRFVRDMHDGVGGHLLSLLMRVRADDADSKDVAEELERGLTVLRLRADSLDHVGHDLDEALAAFQRRAAQQLR